MGKKRVTIYDIAKALEISASTVTRALNGQPGVGEAMRSRIVATAEELGYRANRVARSLTRERKRIGVVIPDRVPDFHEKLITGARMAAEELADFNVEGEFLLIPCAGLRERVIEELRRFAREGFDGVIFVPNAHYGYEEILQELAEKHIAVGTVLIDAEGEGIVVSVCPDSHRAGSLAADLFHMSGIAKGGEVLIEVGFSELSNHRACVEGFRQQNQSYGMRVAATVQNYDDPVTAYHLTTQMLTEMPSIRGIYCGTGMTAPVCKAVCDLGRQGDVVVVGTEITREIKEYLNHGPLIATLFQDPVQQGRKAFRAMYEHLEGHSSGQGRQEIHLNPQIVLPGNVDFYSTYLEN